MNASEAAKHLGISVKALRLYEARGLVVPARTSAGWRVYGPNELARAAEVAALRALGLSLAQIARVLKGELQDMAAMLAAHQLTLEAQTGALVSTARKVAALRQDLARGQAPALKDMLDALAPATGLSVAFELPLPWGGERFELRDIRAINYITGPLGSGKTQLAMRLAKELPDAVFIGLDRKADPARTARIENTVAWLLDNGASRSGALIGLLAAMESGGASILVIDMVEQGLDQATQDALIAHLRRRGPAAKPLFLMTRSTAILDLDAVGPNETIIYCPANHSVPMCVAPYPGTPGYEALASCLAAPKVRARTEGVIAMRISPAG
jgi:DNA-binding transcriptional MerR regulator